jgi:hypothetical protein
VAGTDCTDPATAYPRLRRQVPAERLDGTTRLVLLHEREHRVQHHHREDRPRQLGVPAT